MPMPWQAAFHMANRQLTPPRSSLLDTVSGVSYSFVLDRSVVLSSPSFHRAPTVFARSADSSTSFIHSFYPVTMSVADGLAEARRPDMAQSTQSALTPECLTDDEARPELVQREHKLPFNTDSADWTRTGQSREAAELRMTQLVKTLESEVIPRLLAAHRASPTGTLPLVSLCPPPTDQEVSAFVQLILNCEDLRVHDCINDIRRKGMSVEMVYLDLLAPAAKELGEMWADDRCDFTAVTIGLGRLQLLLQELSPAFGTEVQFPANARRVLLMPAPGDQHTFGLSMVAEFFGRKGWEVASGNITSMTNAVDMARSEWFDVIGFSVGSDSRLDTLKDCIATVRQVSRNKNVGVMVGGPVFLESPELVQTVGADCTAVDAKNAPIQAEVLIGKRVVSR